MPILTLDAESYYDTEYSLRKMPMASYIRDPRFICWGAAAKIDDGPTSWIPAADLPTLFDALRASGKEWHLLGQNTMFDAAIYAWHYGWVADNYIDIMGMSRAVIGPRIPSHSLDGQCHYWGLPGKIKSAALAAMKGNRNPTPEQLANLGYYACDDSEQTYRIFCNLRPYFPESEYPVLDWTIRMFVQPQLALDADMLNDLYYEELDRRATLLATVGLDITTIRSNEKFAEALELLGVMPPMKISKTTNKVAYAFSKQDQDFVELLNHEDVDVALLVEARLGLKSSIVETRTLKYWQVSQTGDLWPVDLQYSGAQQTHRLSGGGGGGGNVQNMNRRTPAQRTSGKPIMRDAIIAPPGKVLVVADSAQIELRVSARICGQYDINDALANKQDLYSSFATDVYGRPITKADAEERQTGKVAVLQLGYQSGADTFRRAYAVETRKAGNPKTISGRDAQMVVDKYRARFHRYPTTWRDLGDRLSVMCNGGVPTNLDSNPPLEWGKDYIIGPSGLALKYPDIGWRQVPDKYAPGATKNAITFTSKAKGKSNASGLKQIYGGALLENLSQFLAREIITHQANVIMAETGILPAMQVHDELIFVVDPVDIAAFSSYVERVMSEPVPWWPELLLSCEVGSDTVYGKAK